MTAHRIWISRGQQLEDEIWADSQRCQDSIVELLQPGSPDTAVSYGAVPGGVETQRGHLVRRLRRFHVARRGL